MESVSSARAGCPKAVLFQPCYKSSSLQSSSNGSTSLESDIGREASQKENWTTGCEEWVLHTRRTWKPHVWEFSRVLTISSTAKFKQSSCFIPQNHCHGTESTLFLLFSLILPVYGPLAQNFFWTNFNTLSSSCWGKKKEGRKKVRGEDLSDHLISASVSPNTSMCPLITEQLMFSSKKSSCLQGRTGALTLLLWKHTCPISLSNVSSASSQLILAHAAIL